MQVPAHVSQVTSVIHTQDVDRNAYRTLNVLEINLVLIINAKIRALELVESTRNASLTIICPAVIVCLDLLEILQCLAIQYLSYVSIVSDK